MKTSILLPTWMRKEKFCLALESLEKQTVQANEIITIYRNIDTEAKIIIKKFSNRLPLKPIEINTPGVIYAENTAISNASGDLILFLDDDAEALLDGSKR